MQVYRVTQGLCSILGWTVLMDLCPQVVSMKLAGSPFSQHPIRGQLVKRLVTVEVDKLYQSSLKLQ